MTTYTAITTLEQLQDAIDRGARIEFTAFSGDDYNAGFDDGNNGWVVSEAEIWLDAMGSKNPPRMREVQP